MYADGCVRICMHIWMRIRMYAYGCVRMNAEDADELCMCVCVCVRVDVCT